jgi:hypothetical protein
MGKGMVVVVVVAVESRDGGDSVLLTARGDALTARKFATCCQLISLL